MLSNCEAFLFPHQDELPNFMPEYRISDDIYIIGALNMLKSRHTTLTTL